VVGVRLECAGVAGVVLRFRQDGRKTAAGFWQRGRGGGGIYSGGGLGEGLGFAAMRESDGSGHCHDRAGLLHSEDED
jgi:hypothetical protein